MKKSYASAVKSRNYPQDRPWYLTQPTQSNVRVTGDDTVDNVEKSKATTAIFIHAGAGFHSTANEAAHLGACSEAAHIAMKFLNAGATAAEAVEAAIRSLEDTEITNAGYGSNLSIDGKVECDATIVDHLGRSGACGAVPHIKNPISLAKLILDRANQPLSLRRVPPNILVGNGATEFAREHGIPIVPNDFLISRNAKDRYIRWSEDLKRAESMVPSSDDEHEESEASSTTKWRPPKQIPLPDQRDHINAILTGTFNEGQPDSPHPGSPSPVKDGSPLPIPTRRASQSSTTTVGNGGKASSCSPLNYMGDMKAKKTRGSPSKRTRVDGKDHEAGTASPPLATNTEAAVLENCSRHDGPEDIGRSSSGKGNASTPPHASDGTSDVEDLITDTIGAIAVDQSGNIAAGSSSGGIGMKHSGRIGPAALVGIGSAVLPVHADDEDETSVAAVTSGTGEHMATTIAAYTCAQRLYHNARSGPGGQLVDEYDEAQLMQSTILDDFIGHPGVKDQNSKGAIGIMAVKKTRTGYYFHFAHSTDSFALASMSSKDKAPRCVMSRLNKHGKVAQGARKIPRD
ncbi:uncharacterized protein E0L32_007355 [Thyridium curvatum]|uniref:Uncharacterized protein n=1 Tax=Thyridium curvatum TaxID=1093900 RepID=A0A507AWK8_9PEZI|nr:uncharacterized protein E0L32_007355 [Thyridium curvatum]TPX11857.1 hypothetical protein E0L32_007355 [Thyridium curvatum]